MEWVVFVTGLMLGSCFSLVTVALLKINKEEKE